NVIDPRVLSSDGAPCQPRVPGRLEGQPSHPGYLTGRGDEIEGRQKCLVRAGVGVMEPPIGIEPTTYALREACSPALVAWPARIPRWIAAMALIALGFRGEALHDPFHEQTAAVAGPPQAAWRPGGPDRGVRIGPSDGPSVRPASRSAGHDSRAWLELDRAARPGHHDELRPERKLVHLMEGPA